MKIFEVERTFTEELSAPQFKEKIPCIYFTPIQETQNTSVFIFIGGISATLQFVRILNYPFFNEHYLLSYERMAHGNNKNKAKRTVSPYVREIDIIVEYAKRKFPNKKVYLLGESGGSHLSLLYLKKYGPKINYVYCGNMPSHVIDPRKKTLRYSMGLAMKMILTICFGVQTWDKQANDATELMSTNPEIIRMMKMSKAGTHSNNKINIATGGSFKPAGKFLLKHANDDQYNMIYFQSAEDFMCKIKFINKVKAKYPNSKHICFLEKGYHILSKEEPANEIMFNIIMKSVAEQHK